MLVCFGAYFIHWGLMKPIALAWVITLPAAAILSALAFIALSQVLG